MEKLVLNEVWHVSRTLDVGDDFLFLFQGECNLPKSYKIPINK